LQQYSEKKDIQYEKEAHNLELLDGRLAKIDQMQQKISLFMGRFEEVNRQVHAQTTKIEQIKRIGQDREQGWQGAEARLG
jgi:hypothetical protein